MAETGRSGERVVGWHIGEGVSVWNSHLVGCLNCTEPANHVNPVTVAEAERYDADGFAYVCDKCERPLLRPDDRDPVGEDREAAESAWPHHG